MLVPEHLIKRKEVKKPQSKGITLKTEIGEMHIIPEIPEPVIQKKKRNKSISGEPLLSEPSDLELITED